MPLTISIINLKGGVGKTTLTTAMAEFMAVQHQLKVLVMDLDPQTNATVSLMDEYEWKKRNIKGQTIMQIFKDRLAHQREFSAKESIVRSVSNIGGGIKGLDLLPSSLDLIDIQDKIGWIPSNGIFCQRPITLLGEAMAEAMNDYDVVLIDCPPNLGLITQNGLVLSQYYLIPVLPDVLSTYGIPQIVNRVKRLQKETGIPIEPMGVVINRYRQKSKLHLAQTKILQQEAEKGGYKRVFEVIIPEASRAAAAMDYTLEVNTLHDKYSYDAPYKQYKQLAEEVLQYGS
ncbi:MAG: ParA family protein [Bacillota bacterium]|nr:ParA family protein [Bacillota bacterium]